MEESKEIYTLGFWTVKKDKESEFIDAWDKFAQWTMRNQPGTVGTASLIQDVSNPSSFISFGAWENTATIENWRARPEFKVFFAEARELCEDIKPSTWKVAATVTGRE